MRRGLAYPTHILALCGAGALLLSGCGGQGSGPAAESPAPATVTVTAEASSAPSSSPASGSASSNAASGSASSTPVATPSASAASGSASSTPASGMAQAGVLPVVEAAGMTAVEKTFPVDQGQYRHEPDRGMVGGGSQQCREAVDAVRAAQDGVSQAIGRKYHGTAGRGGHEALMVQVTTDSPRDLGALFGDVERACAEEDGRVGGPQSTFETVQLTDGGGFVSTKSPAQESARGYFAASTDTGELIMLVNGLSAEDARALFEAQLDAVRG